MTQRRRELGVITYGDWHGGDPAAMRQAAHDTVALAVDVERHGFSAFALRTHHFKASASAAVPLLAAAAARTERIALLTAVIDLRYEVPLHLAEELSTLDLLSDGRLRIGLGRGAPGMELRAGEDFGRTVDDPQGADPVDAQQRATILRTALSGVAVAQAEPAVAGGRTSLPLTPFAAGLAERLSWGSGSYQSAVWAGFNGFGLMSSTVLASEAADAPFDRIQAEQIAVHAAAWEHAGRSGAPHATIVRTVLPVMDESERPTIERLRSALERGGAEAPSTRAGVRAAQSHLGNADDIVVGLLADEAVAVADTVLLTVPMRLGAGYARRMVEYLGREVVPHLTA